MLYAELHLHWVQQPTSAKSQKPEGSPHEIYSKVGHFKQNCY